LIESNQTNADNILTILRHHGIEAGHVATGPDALGALREGARESRPYDVAVLDMDTPGMDGLTLARAIKAEPSISGTKILILTTVTHQVETNLLNASNIGACLTKPLKQSKLSDYLQAALSENAGPRPATHHLPDINDIFAPFLPPHGGIPPRIIIAEDNSINQKVAKGLLARLGFASEIVSDGRALLRALEITPRDIVFMDCQLPVLDGLQATRELRQREQSSKSDHRTYVIAMTADAVPGAREKCITAGMNDYLSKPIRPEELQAVLRRAIEMVNLSAKNGDQRHPFGYIDPSVMETLRLLKTPGQPDPLPLLIDEYVGAAQNRLEELQTAVIDRNKNVIETAAHSLRGSSAGIGAMRLASLSAELEEGIRNGSFNESAAVLSQMDEEFLLVKTALEFEKER
jgi:CheY-like chemotaxis protein/HPt (histidine-containing phosphotransfer) domain-containing protein